KIIPATNNLLPKTTRTKKGTSHTNWHWLIKHPVEFSKNNHTPDTNRRTLQPAPGALVQLYSRYFVPSNRSVFR
ncbi:hypothetical protein, partial [Jidongwangia harbinensis]|uniref:hypothetical protein n=1 Tax=Jidongwangia harbinensis TaxID=2878561 RepID=UPI001CD97B29